MYSTLCQRIQFARVFEFSWSWQRLLPDPACFVWSPGTIFVAEWNSAQLGTHLRHEPGESWFVESGLGEGGLGPPLKLEQFATHQKIC